MENTKSGPGGKASFSQRMADTLKSRFGLRFWIEVGLSLCLFFYYWFAVHPEYIQFARQPVFFLERGFFLEQLQLPGGISDYAAAFLTELLQFELLGAALLTILVLVFYHLLNLTLHAGKWWIALLIPTIILAALQTDSNYSLVGSLALIIAMAAFALYRNIKSARNWVRLSSTVPFVIVVYLLSPYALLIFTVLCVMYEVFNGNSSFLSRTSVSAALIAAALIVPWLAKSNLFIISTSDAFLRHSPLWVGDTFGIPPIGKIYFEIILGVSVLASAGIFFYRAERQGNVKSNLRMILVQIGVAAAVLIMSFWQVVSKSDEEFLAIRYTTHAGEWNQTLSFINPSSTSNLLNLFHFVQAYYHTGRMDEEFTWLRQNVASQGLFLKNDICYEYPLDYSDFMYELGSINESKHWALEALTHYGESENVLKRLALTNILEGNFAAAQEFLYRLRQNPFSSSWANHYLACIKDPSKFRQEFDLQQLHTYMTKVDFIINDNHPEIDLRIMLGQFPRNEMAYRYLLMYDLLTRNLNLFANDFLQLRMNENGPMPQLYEEALVAFLSTNPSMDSVASKIGIRKETVDRFKGLYALISQHHGDAGSIYSELSQNYGDTYWFYLLRVVPTN
ncbi:MAG TPA: DUF6057 family protein [Candidatus Acidoferrales bacterium]|nr:DUF6057 family protein [Candidatus Acidoferrales bacterium]